MLVASEKRARLYERRFDHEEAARRYRAGESKAALAAEFGVTESAVAKAIQFLDPAAKQRANEYRHNWCTGTCDDCGGPAMRLISGKLEHNPDGRTLCRELI